MARIGVRLREERLTMRQLIDLARLETLNLTLDDVAAFLESMPFIRFAFTEDQVRSVRLP